MSPRAPHPTLRHLLLLAVLVFTLPLSGLALDPGAAAPSAPQAAPAPQSAASPAPAKTDTATTEGKASSDKPAKAADKPYIEHIAASSYDPKSADLPEVKPVNAHYDRDAEIGERVGQILEGNHYSKVPISAEMSQRWLKNYLDALDYNHLFFLQSDIDEFTAKYGNYLGDLLLHGRTPEQQVYPAYEIYSRYMQRLDENVILAEKLLHDSYDFTKPETYAIRNNKSPWIPDAATSAAVWRGQVKSDLLNGLLEKKSPDETIKRLSKRYSSLLRDATEDDDTDVIQRYFTALTHAYDPHSDYFSPQEAQNFNIIALKHEVTGIGAVLRTDDGYATIEEVITGGPADLDKRLQAGDRILAVGQGTDKPVDAVYMKLDKVVDMIRGARGSMVRLIVVPAGAVEGAPHKVIDIKRDTVSIKDRLAKAHVIDHQLPDGTMQKIGVIELRDFYDNTAVHVAKLVEGLKKENVDGIILDFRNNGGGLLDQAVDLTGLFVKRGTPVVQIRRSDGYVDQLPTEATHSIYDGPLLVMVNKASASATEIVAAALQDYGRAIVVGDQSTHGKGTVQTLIDLDQQMPIGFPDTPGAGKLKMTIQKFFRVSGGSTQQKGVVPDIILPSVLDALELGETTLPYYLPYDTVAAVPYTYYNQTRPYLDDLRANSAARVAASPDFGYVKQDIAYYKKRIQDSTVSLNLNTRVKDQDDFKAQMAKRKKDLAARQNTRDKELDLTLDMIDNNQPPAPPADKKPKVSLGDDDGSDPDADLSNSINNPKDDPQLDEAVNVMTDYTRLLRDNGSKLTQTAAAPAPASK